MKKTFLISGSIVGTEEERETFEDVTPAQINSFLKGLGVGDEVEFQINSWGGDVAAGLAICNLVKAASVKHKITAHVIGVAASMASAIACCGSELLMDENTLMCVHLPWTVLQGNARDMEKEIAVLEKYTDALIQVYRTKFDLTDEAIRKLLEDETWILAENAGEYKLAAEIIPTESPMRIAASMKGLKRFNHIPGAIMEKIEKANTMENEKQANAEIITDVENKADETPAEVATVEEPTQEKPTEAEAEKPTEAEPEVMITQAEVEARVSGMQSVMAKQIDALRKDYEARIKDFEIQLKGRDEELEKAKAEAISLASNLDKVSAELSETTSALKQKDEALATLNAKVNTPSVVDAKPWQKLHGEALLQWARENQAH